jgi:hypothetical protein
MTTAAITMAEELCQFTKQYADSYHCLELLRFFGRYPHAQFSELAVVRALNLNREKLSTKRVLRQFVDKGVLRISICNNISLYSLTEDESLCRLASNLVKFNWRQWQLMLRQTLPTPVQ